MFVTVSLSHSPNIREKARSDPCVAPYGTPIQWWAPSLAQKYLTRVKVIGNDKHAGLLSYVIEYGCKTFIYQRARGQC